jgi:CRISPR-associated protein Cas5d
MSRGEKAYDVQLEIAGPAAMFTRPDTGATPVSYPAPTYSAAKGIFECVARLKSAFIMPTKVEICAPLRFQRYTTNYGGPLRKSNQLSGGSPYQLLATVLIDVCYRIHGTVKERYVPDGVKTNHLHHLQRMFEWRLSRGKCFQVPCLGWREFTPSYFGPFRRETRVDESISIAIPSMLFSVFEHDSRYNPVFKQNVEIVKGSLVYAQ